LRLELWISVGEAQVILDCHEPAVECVDDFMNASHFLVAFIKFTLHFVERVFYTIKPLLDTIKPFFLPR